LLFIWDVVGKDLTQDWPPKYIVLAPPPPQKAVAPLDENFSIDIRHDDAYEGLISTACFQLSKKQLPLVSYRIISNH